LSEITVVVIDDEFLGREVLKSYIKKIPELTFVGEASNGIEGLKVIQEQNPDLVFLDIQMPKLTGFEMLELLEKVPPVIFTTAYDQYAIQAFDVNAIDYLLKPISFERFKTSIDRILQQKEQNIQGSIDIQRFVTEQSRTLERLVVKDGQKIHVINLAHIEYIEAQDDYIMIYTAEGKYLKKQTMKSLEDKLDPNVFIRVHRSYFVNIDFVKQVLLIDKDTYQARLSETVVIPVSKSGYQLLMAKLK
jgi:two-component system LytT family response regulator